MVDQPAVYQPSSAGDQAPASGIRSMVSFVAGVVFTALGLAVVVDELSGLNFAQTVSLAGFSAALVVFGAALFRARSGGDTASPTDTGPGS